MATKKKTSNRRPNPTRAELLPLMERVANALKATRQVIADLKAEVSRGNIELWDSSLDEAKNGASSLFTLLAELASDWALAD